MPFSLMINVLAENKNGRYLLRDLSNFVETRYLLNVNWNEVHQILFAISNEQLFPTLPVVEFRKNRAQSVFLIFQNHKNR
jgi:hypothetical protein